MPRYAVYDVFTGTPFAGNPLAVVLDGAEVGEDRLQPVAREFGFSETTFVFPPEDGDDAPRVRIFTPERELPFAGHPVIGTAVALSDEGGPDRAAMHLGVGRVETRVTRGTPSRAAFDMTATPERSAWTDADAAAGLAGLDAADLTGRMEVASVGLPFLLVEVRDAAALARAVPDAAAARRIAATGGPVCHLVWTRDGDGIRQRMFAPAEGIEEDPATGSASAVLGACLALDAGGPLDLSLRQGVEMGRPSEIAVAARPSGDGSVAITVGGGAVRVMEGRLCLP